MGYLGIEIGRILNLTGPAVTKCLPCRYEISYRGLPRLPRRSGRSYWDVEKGKKILDENEELTYKLIS